MNSIKLQKEFAHLHDMHVNCDRNKECTYEDNFMIQTGPLKHDEPLSESPLQVTQPIQTRLNN